MILAGIAITGTCSAAESSVDRPEYSGIYPHLTFFNNGGECGTGAVVPWGGYLWAALPVAGTALAYLAAQIL